MKDKVAVLDHLTLSGGGLQRVAVPVEEEGAKVQIRGFFSAVCREGGKLVPGTLRQGENIWTLTGREYLAHLMSYTSHFPDVAARNDRIRYLGFGVGTTPEVSSVSRLVSPIAYDLTGGGLFLAPLAIPTYPFGTAARYTREFSELELSTSGTVTLTEAGLFTDGSHASVPVPFTTGSRVLTLALATSQAPAAYKSFEPLKKTQNFVLQVAWEIRF